MKIGGIFGRAFFATGMQNRGTFIVFEGCDKSGKTTQCNRILKRLTDEGVKAQLMKFPDRTTRIGQMINGYLGKTTQLEDHSIHLLFSANRWECVPKMKELLTNGTSLIVDRYAYSGVAYTAVKKGFSLDWCKQADVGLPKPDKVIYLTLNPEAAAKRSAFGEERYESEEFQNKVAANFDKLKEKNWQVVDADKTVDELHEEIYTIVKDTINFAKLEKLKTLWTS